MNQQVINELGQIQNADNSNNNNISKDIQNLATLIRSALSQKANSSDLDNVKSELSSLKGFVQKYVKTPPVNISLIIG